MGRGQFRILFRSAFFNGRAISDCVDPARLFLRRSFGKTGARESGLGQRRWIWTAGRAGRICGDARGGSASRTRSLYRDEGRRFVELEAGNDWRRERKESGEFPGERGRKDDCLRFVKCKQTAANLPRAIGSGADFFAATSHKAQRQFVIGTRICEERSNSLEGVGRRRHRRNSVLPG